jgi:hypothetical protein
MNTPGILDNAPMIIPVIIPIIMVINGFVYDGEG